MDDIRDKIIKDMIFLFIFIGNKLLWVFIYILLDFFLGIRNLGSHLYFIDYHKYGIKYYTPGNYLEQHYFLPDLLNTQLDE